MYLYIYVRTHIYGTYIPSEGLEYPSEIFWEIFWYKKFCGKINMQQGIRGSYTTEVWRANLALFGINFVAKKFVAK